MSNTISVVDLEAQKVVATIPAGAGTWGVAIVDAGKQATGTRGRGQRPRPRR